MHVAANDHHSFDVNGDDVLCWLIDAATGYGPAVRLVGVYATEQHALDQVSRFRRDRIDPQATPAD